MHNNLLMPIVSIVPMYDENAIPVEVSVIRAHFFDAGLRRLSNVGVVENWGIFEEAALYSSFLTLSYLDNDDLPGYIGSSVMIFPVRQKSDLLEELLSLGYYDSSDVDKNKNLLSKRLTSEETEYWSTPQKEHLLDWKLRKNLPEKMLADSKNKIRL